MGRRKGRKPNAPRASLGSIALIVVSALFVVAGLVLAISGEIFGIIVIVFFSACLLVGLMRLPTMGARTRMVLTIIGCWAFAVACAVIVVLTLSGADLDLSYVAQPVLVVLAAIGVVFFGGGGLVLAVAAWRNRTSPDAADDTGG